MKQTKLFKGLLASLMLLCSAHTWAYDFEVDNIQYTITSFDDMTVEVSGLTDNDVTEVIISENVEYRDRTLTVTSIGSKAFQSNETLETASISKTVTSIGTYAFDGCSALKEVIMGGGVTSIGSYAFRSCVSLNSVTIPNSVTSIGEYAFYGCTSIEKATIGNSVTSIGSYAFYDCSSLLSVIIPNSVTSIGDYAFRGCSSLTEIAIPNSVTSIRDYTFYDCSSLTEVTIPNSVTSIGSYAFYGCCALKELNLPDSVDVTTKNIFVGCTSIESFSVGKGCSILFEDATYSNDTGSYRSYYYPIFWTDGPTKMKDITLRDGSSTFHMRGYSGNSYYGSITPGYPIFSNIEVEYFYVGRPLDEIKSWSYVFTRYSRFDNYFISTSSPYGQIETLEIGGYCIDVPYFYQSIKNLILGEEVATYTVENIYQDNLTSIVCKSTTPPKLTGTFDNRTYLNVVLYVPIGSMETYQAAEGWRNFWDIIEADVSGIDDIVNTGDVTEVARYTIRGQKINTPQRGINIIRYSDGTTKKVLVK